MKMKSLQWYKTNTYIYVTSKEFTHCGLVMPYGNMDLGHLWLRQGLCAVRQQAIAWTDVNFSFVRLSGINLLP